VTAYSFNAAGKCRLCESITLNLTFYAVCGTLGLVVTYLVLRKLLITSSLSGMSKEATRIINDDVAKLKTKLKILTSFYQVSD